MPHPSRSHSRHHPPRRRRRSRARASQPRASTHAASASSRSRRTSSCARSRASTPSTVGASSRGCCNAQTRARRTVSPSWRRRRLTRHQSPNHRRHHHADSSAPLSSARGRATIAASRDVHQRRAAHAMRASSETRAAETGDSGRQDSRPVAESTPGARPTAQRPPARSVYLLTPSMPCIMYLLHYI